MSGKIMRPGRRYELGRGTGDGPDYKGFIKPREARSFGNATNYLDAVSGRMEALLSDGELRWFMHLRFNDEAAEILEQKVLEQKAIERICREYGKRPGKYLSTDFLVIRADGTKEAYSIKADEVSAKSDKTQERIAIERLYWEEQGVPFFLRYKTDISVWEHFNLLTTFPNWEAERTYDDFSLARHLIVRKKIAVDITQPIDFEEFVEEHREEIEVWKRLYRANW